MKNLLFFLFLGQMLPVSAKIWSVGPGRLYLVPSSVSNLVAHGDTVEVDAGLYSGDVTKWFADDLVIRRVGDGFAHLAAAGNYVEGKAIWVIKGARCTVEGFEFSGCQVPDHNGAGIRQEGRDLTLRDCYFHHNEMGILTANDGVSDYVFEACEFAFNGYGDGYSHNIYVGNVHSLTMRFCYSHDAHIGHLVKSRARYNNLYYNRLTGEMNDGSYEIDMPNGGRAVLIGNVIEQSANSQNGGIITFALENQSHPEQQLVLSHNTVVNHRNNGRFVHIANGTALLKMVNNLFVGSGTWINGTPIQIDSSHNLHITDPQMVGLQDPDNFQFGPTAASPVIDAGTQPGEWNGIPLTALYAYLHPLSSTARWYSGSAPDMGAYEYLVAPYRMVEGEILMGGLRVFPNPVAKGGHLQIGLHEPLKKSCKLLILNELGGLVHTTTWPAGQSEFTLYLPDLPAGKYWIQRSDAAAGIWVLVQ